ncbi:MAG TPA: hypothetical protein VMZ51_05595 [Acidimicrobiales bacterium]|nr:hypothetical protein [Acidimicrobiales bacterium]
MSTEAPATDTSAPAPASALEDTAVAEGADVGPDRPTLQARLAEAGAPTRSERGKVTVEDPVNLLRSLAASGRFHRDTGFGRLFHPGKISLRENVPTNSLHILVKDNGVSAHVDLVSPLGLRPGASSRYTAGRVAAHNLSGMAADVVRLLRGRQGDHRCELACEWFRPADDDAGAGVVDEVDGCDGGSASVQFEARVAGRVDEVRLADALAAALCTHPDALRVVDCTDDEALAATRVEFQDFVVPLRECPPLRVLLARHAAGDVLMLNVNHAASDGFGALRILQALARAYVSDGLDLPRLEFLALRDLPVRPASRRVPALMKWYLGLIEWLRNALAPPARLVADGGDPTESAGAPDDDPGYGFHLVTLPLGDRAGGLSLAPPAIDTDVLIAGLHRAIGAWNAAHGCPGHRISVLVPSDLRPSGWPDELVGNFSVTARVSTSRRHRGSLAAALKTVGSQTRRNNRSRTGIALISALDRTGLLPLWTRQSRIVLQPITRNRFVDTAILCDLGRIADPPSFGAGGGKTNEVWFSVPARVPVPLSVGAATLGGRLHLSLRYSRHLFGPEAASRFTEHYLAELDPTRPAPAEPWGPDELPRSG